MEPKVEETEKLETFAVIDLDNNEVVVLIKAKDSEQARTKVVEFLDLEDEEEDYIEHVLDFFNICSLDGIPTL